MLANSDFVMRGYLRNELNFKRSSKSTATTGHVEATLQLVLTGHYIGVIPDHIANRWVTTGRLVKLPLPDTPGRAVVYLIYRDKARANPTVSAFIEDIVDCYSKS
jgi:DNA-binding transcriptional LysR family regulator